jgi:VWFA-related protein
MTAPVLLTATIWSQAPQTPQTQRPVFRARTDYISTDVRVTDRRGVFVPGLTQDDFQVLEDGVPQRIVLFQPVVGGRVLPPFVSAGAASREGVILPARATDTLGRIFIVFIDDMHLQPGDTPLVRQALRQIRDEVIKPNDLIAVVSTGFSSIAVDLTYDPEQKRLNEAIDKVMGSADTPRSIIDMPPTSGGVQKLRYNANVAFRTASDLLTQAAKRSDRRKAFLYVSSGYSFNPYQDSRIDKAKEALGTAGSADPIARPGSDLSEMDLIGQLAYLADEARRANVVFYPIDPRGLMAGPNIADRLTENEWREFMTTTLSSLHLLGDATGGFCSCEKNDIRPLLRRIDQEMGDYYVIGYNTNNPDPMKLRRRIEITVNRQDVNLIYKSEYTLPQTERR